MSSKRHRSSSPPGRHGAVNVFPPPDAASSLQRLQNGLDASAIIRHTISDLFPYQELLMRILSFLTPTELALMQGVSKYWAKMSLDPQVSITLSLVYFCPLADLVSGVLNNLDWWYSQLWKRLYLSRYPHPHHSRLIYKSQASSTPSRSLRPIARLPSRAFPPPSPTRSASATPIAHPAPSPAGPGPDPPRLLQGIGRARPLATDSSIPTGEVGYGVRNDGVDWKMMFRLGTNWSNGNALSQTTIPLPPSPSPSISSKVAAPPSRSLRPPPYSEQHIALFPSFIFTSNPTSPLVHVHLSSTSVTSDLSTAAHLGIIPPPPGWSSPTRPDNVTAICADQSVVLPQEDPADPTGINPALPARLAVFYQSGGFVVLRACLLPGDRPRTSWTREAVHPALSRPRSARRRATIFTPLAGDPVVLASMHYPLLLTCTLAFHLSVYTLSPPSSIGEPLRPKHLQTMHSDVSFHPAALTLFPMQALMGDDSPTKPSTSTEDALRHFRAALTYCTPLYPSSWTVAVQEFGVDLQSTLDTQPATGDVWRNECWNVGRGDEGASDDRPIWPRKVRPIVGVKGHAVGVGMDGRWCVLAGEDNQIQVYSLPTPSPSPPPRPAPIVHSQTLLAHSAAVTSISLSAGRCVSGGRDGRVLIWELDDDLSDDEGDGRLGRTVGYVVVRQGGRRTVWRGAAGPGRDEDEEDLPDATFDGMPHPQSISSAARSLFLPRPPDLPHINPIDDRPPAIRQLAFDEEKIVGLVRTEREVRGTNVPEVGEVMKVWSFNG